MYFGDVLDSGDKLHDFKLDKPEEFDTTLKQCSLKLKSVGEKNTVSQSLEFKGDPFSKADFVHKTVLDH